jgi:hypothetical protein
MIIKEQAGRVITLVRAATFEVTEVDGMPLDLAYLPVISIYARSV